MKTRYLTFFLIFVASISYGQIFFQNDSCINLSGHIYNQGDSSSIPYANIIISNKYKGTITDIGGYFEIEACYADTIIISAVGFKSDIKIFNFKITENSIYKKFYLFADTLQIKTVDIFKDRWKYFKEDIINMKPENMPPDAIQLPGLPKRYLGPPTVEAPSPVFNPVTFLYSKLNKQARQKRQIKRNRGYQDKTWFEVERRIPDNFDWDNPE